MTNDNTTPQPHNDLSAARDAVQAAQDALKSAKATLRKAQKEAEPPAVELADQSAAEQERLTPERMRQKHKVLADIEDALYSTAQGYYKVHGTISPPGSNRAAARLDYAESLRHFVMMDPEKLYRDGDPDNARWAMQQILRSGTDAGYIGVHQCWQAW